MNMVRFCVLKNGANMECPKNRRRTPLDLARAQYNHRMEELLASLRNSCNDENNSSILWLFEISSTESCQDCFGLHVGTLFQY